MSGAPTPKALHFLVVDDDLDSRATVVDYLKKLGHDSIIAVGDGAEALRILGINPAINFIISDWDMPVMNGFELLQKVKADPVRAQIPFVIVTSPISQESEKVILAAENLVDSYLIKPFRIQLFEERIQQVLNTVVRGVQKQALVVDDDNDAREMVVEYLKNMGFRDVVAQADGRAGLEYLTRNSEKVGLIVSDWEMPELSGVDLLRVCKSSPKLSGIPFLMITSQTSIERMKIMQAAKANVDEYLLKPFNSAELRRRVETVLDKARHRSEVLGVVTEGIEHLEYGRLTRAEDCFGEALRLDPTNEHALRGMGDVTAKSKGSEAALPYYKRAVEANPANLKGYLKLAAAYEQVGLADKAIALLQAGLSELSFSADLHFQLGRLYGKKNMHAKAKAEFEKTLELQLDHQEARLMLELMGYGGGSHS